MMNSKTLIMVYAVVFPTVAHAEDLPPSLFFSAQEAREAELLAEKSAPAGVGDIRLGAIMYYSESDWILWVRGEKWTPETAHDDLRILQVSPNFARLSWKQDADSPEKEIILRPNEIYQVATGKIVASP